MAWAPGRARKFVAILVKVNKINYYYYFCYYLSESESESYYHKLIRVCRQRERDYSIIAVFFDRQIHILQLGINPRTKLEALEADMPRIREFLEANYKEKDKVRSF